MKVRSKRYRACAAKVAEANPPLPLEEAVGLLKELPSVKFDETVELAVNLGVDPRKSDQMVRGAFSLPHGTGKKRRVIAFAEGEAAKEAKEAGAIEVGGVELVEKVQKGWLDFDVAVSTPAMMRHVRKLGRILGPQGKMPSPKAGTVSENIGQAVQEFMAGKIEYRVDSGGVVHVPVGKKSFSKEQLVENIDAFLNHLASQRPASAKGTFIRKVTVCSTMGPGIEVLVKKV